MKKGHYIRVDSDMDEKYNLVKLLLYEMTTEGIIDVLELNEAIYNLRKKYSLPVLELYERKNNNSSND